MQITTKYVGRIRTVFQVGIYLKSQFFCLYEGLSDFFNIKIQECQGFYQE